MNLRKKYDILGEVLKNSEHNGGLVMNCEESGGNMKNYAYQKPVLNKNEEL